MMAIHAVPAFSDNYLWVMERGGNAAVVDPGDAAAVDAFLASNGLTLACILATHHHGDHVGGLAALKARWNCPAYGPAREDIAGLDRRLGEGDRVAIPGLEVEFSVLDVPGHTAGHIAYVGEGAVFCGDTMFACGCGRLFEGTPAQMAASLAKLAALPAGTRMYCAHEYTLANIRFAQRVEPGNAALAARRARDEALRDQDLPTLPSTIGEERDTNPFLRCEVPEVRDAASGRAGRRLTDPVDVFATLREWKNQFR